MNDVLVDCEKMHLRIIITPYTHNCITTENRVEQVGRGSDEARRTETKFTTKYELGTHMYQHKNIAVIGNTPCILQRAT